MHFTDIFIKRPVLAIVVNLVIVIAGIQAISSLSVRQYPRSDLSKITVQTVYIGADAELVRGFITTPLEQAIAQADGIEFIESRSTLGLSEIEIRLRLNYDPNTALAEISSKIDQVRNDLPPEAEVPTLNVETADTQFASAYLSFDSEILEQNEITDYLLRVVQPRLSAVEGVQRAQILGERIFAMRIWLDPVRMAGHGISASEVRSALEANNYLSAVGQTKGNLMQVNLTANTDLNSVEEFRDLVVRQSEGRVVRLREIADVVLGAENYDAEVSFTGQTAVFMGIWPLPTTNSIEVIQSVRQEIENLRDELPVGLSARVAYDATEYIDSAINEVIFTLAETLTIVVIVIFLFLGSLRTVLIPAIAIPVSLIGAMFLIQTFGFTINLLTLLAIVLAVGLVVDDAIVMVENISRHMREGMLPVKAAIVSARELVFPIFTMTVTLAAVYTPIGLSGGLTGSLFREFAFTLAGAVLISGFVAVTLSPVMASRLLKPGADERGLSAHITRHLDRLRDRYGNFLDLLLRYRGCVYLFWFGLSALAYVFYVMSPKELAPLEDQGVVFGILDAPANATVDQIRVSSDEIFSIYSQIPEMEQTFQVTSPEGGFAGMVLQPWDARDRTVFEIIPELQQKLRMVPGVNVFPVAPPPLPGGSQFPVEIVISSTADVEEIMGFANQLVEAASKSGAFVFPPFLDVKIDQKQARLLIDRDKVADFGLNLQTVGQDIAALIGGNFVNRFNIDGRSYRVIPQVTRMERLYPEQLENLRITGPEGQLIPLSSIVTIEDQVQPRSLNRFQQLNSVKINGPAIMKPLDEALRVIEEEAARILPEGYRLDYTGESRQLRSEGDNFVAIFGLALLLIFLVLAAQFNSFRDPLIILAGSVPLAIFGALIFTFLKMPNPNLSYWTDGFTTTLNIYSQVGLVTLVGIIAKNGILIVQFANALQDRGVAIQEAIREASKTRLRPILMTSLATVFGHMPLVFVSGAGAAARNSIGLIIVCGMAIGTLFTLFVVPALYLLIAKDRSKKKIKDSEYEVDDSELYRSSDVTDASPQKP